MSFFDGLGVRFPGDHFISVDPAGGEDHSAMVIGKVLPFGGMEIIACEYLPKTKREQFRFPRSKKKRIRKKWRKRPENWREADATGDVYMLSGRTFLKKSGDVAIIHPDGFEALMKGLKPVIKNVGTDRKG